MVIALRCSRSFSTRCSGTPTRARLSRGARSVTTRKDAPPVFIASSLIPDERTRADRGRRRGVRESRGRRILIRPSSVRRSRRSPATTRARKIDLANGLALSVECDAHPEAAREQLERLLGPATVVVASGGLWRDHAPIACTRSCTCIGGSRADVGTRRSRALKRARILATAIVGGDATNVPAVHPIRWPGSWHRKGTPRLARIVELDARSRAQSHRRARALELAARRHKRRTAPESATGIALDGEVASTSALVRQLLTGEAMHAPLVALAYRYLRGGMADAQAC
jgi:hypothetical protein